MSYKISAELRQQAPDARLFMHRRELDMMQERANQPEEMERRMRDWLSSNGASDLAEENMSWRGGPAPQLSDEDQALEGGEKLALGEGPEGEWEVMWTPGHTAGHFVLYNPTRKLMLSGDHLLGQISSNVGKYPGSTADPLGDYLSSLRRIAELQIEQVLPAHGLPFGDYRERAQILLRHHDERLAKMHAAVEGEPRTAQEVVKQIWGDRLTGFDRFLALVETLSHMERLLLQKKVVLEERGSLIYFKAA